MTPTEYLASADEAKRPALKKLHHLIRETLPELSPCMVHGMLGYGPYHYRYESGREGDSARVALAVNKSGFSVYLMAVDARGVYIAEKHKASLGKATVGKSCIRFKSVEDIDLGALTAALLEVRTSVALGERRDANLVSAKAKAAKKRPVSATTTRRRDDVTHPPKRKAAKPKPAKTKTG